MSALADATRSRLLLVLERHELTVNELCSVLQLPQSTVSRHLKTLDDDGWVVSRRDGTSRYYAMAAADRDGPARRLWQLVREQVETTKAAQQDARRLASVLELRRSKTQEFFESAAGRWDSVRAELFGEGFHQHALLALLDSNLTVGDFGCGTGQVSATLAPFVGRVVAVDESAAMLQAARRRLKGMENVEVRRGALEELPVESGELDAAVLVLVLHHLAAPERALAETARTLRKGGKALVVDMLPHDREDYRLQMGHVWLGFSESQLRGFFAAAGLGEVRFTALPPDRSGKGPGLFVASAQKKLSA